MHCLFSAIYDVGSQQQQQQLVHVCKRNVWESICASPDILSPGVKHEGVKTFLTPAHRPLHSAGIQSKNSSSNLHSRIYANRRCYWKASWS